MKEVFYIVARKQTRRDDILAIAVCLYYFGDMPVYKREPSEEELGNPRVLVLGTGGRHAPGLRNFDQCRDQSQCQLFKEQAAHTCASTFAQLMHYFVHQEMFEAEAWYRNTKGLDKACADYGLKTSACLFSPIEQGILDAVWHKSVLTPEWTAVLKEIGRQLIMRAKTRVRIRAEEKAVKAEAEAKAESCEENEKAKANRT